MQLCVFGATGPVGRAVVTQALREGHDVTAVTRRPNAFSFEASGLRVVEGDVAEPAQVGRALDGADSVTFTVGVNPSRKPITTYSARTRTVLEAMGERGPRRIVSVSSKNVAERGTRGESLAYRLTLGPLLHAVNRTIYQDMRRMEQLLRGSDRDWTIVRPAGLFPADHPSAYRLTTAHEPGVYTSVVDLADALLSEACGDRPHVGAVIEVLTDADTPSLPALLAGQAALHRR